jgi:D-tyrosyl-tRNA(Tyr) deacylase
MIALLQRVSSASVTIDGDVVASIDQGLLCLIGVQPDDTEQLAGTLLHKILNYRVFSDSSDKMNLSLLDTAGELLLVPQFTLAADTRSGLRPGFSTAAKPDLGARLFGILCDLASASEARCQFGVFGADMQVALVNDGPVTFWLQID